MGWKGTLRSLQAASNRAQRERERADRARHRALTKVDKNVEQVMAKARSLEAKLERDPIKALSLSYTEESGFDSEPFSIETELISASISLTSHDADSSRDSSFRPTSYNTISSFVQPLNILITRWGTIVAFKVSNDDAKFQMRVSWVKKSDPRSSKILLLDEEHSEYYYPFASSISGQIVPGHPRIGLIAFDSFRKPTSTLQLHFSNVQLQGGRGGKHSFSHSYTSPSLAGQIQEMLEFPVLTQRVAEVIDQEAQRLRSKVRQSESGCLLMVFLLVAGGVAAASTLSLLTYF